MRRIRHHRQNIWSTVLQHADDGVRAVDAFVEPAQAVEVTEEFVSTGNDMHNHFGITLDIMEFGALSKQHCAEWWALGHRKSDICRTGTDYSLWTQIVVA